MEVYVVKLSDFSGGSNEEPILCLAETIKAGKTEVERISGEYDFHVFETKEEVIDAIEKDEEIYWVFIWSEEDKMYFGYDVMDKELSEVSDSEITFNPCCVITEM